jgi:hypothetical protein
MFIFDLFHPSTFYYLLFQPSRVFIHTDSGYLENDTDIPDEIAKEYKSIVCGTWTIESPYNVPFDWRIDISKWKKTRLYLYSDGTFLLANPIVSLDYLWEDYHWKDRKGQNTTNDLRGYWKFLHSSHYGLSINFEDENRKHSKFKYMMLWKTQSDNKKLQYKLCQVKELPIDLMGVVWIKVSNNEHQCTCPNTSK